MTVEGQTTTATEATTEAATDTTLVTAPAAAASPTTESEAAAAAATAEAEATAAAEAEAAKAGKKDGEDGEPEAHASIGAPEAYADFETPEGVELDTESLDAFRTTAKELDLSQDAANKLVQHAFALQERWTDQLGQQVLAERQTWLDDTKADKDIGGDKLPETLGTAKRALEAYGDSELTTLLNETGLGNHRAVIRLLANAGKAVSEDGFVDGRKPTAGANSSLADRLYPPKKDK